MFLLNVITGANQRFFTIYWDSSQAESSWDSGLVSHRVWDQTNRDRLVSKIHVMVRWAATCAVCNMSPIIYILIGLPHVVGSEHGDDANPRSGMQKSSSTC